MERVQENLMVNTDDTYLSVTFRKDSAQVVYSRQVQNIFDLLAYVGGFWRAMFAIGFILS